MKDDLHLHRSLKELEDYRTIGTVEEFKEAKDKQEAKEIHVYSNGTEHCPNCDFNLTGGFETFNYCIECGQKIIASKE